MYDSYSCTHGWVCDHQSYNQNNPSNMAMPKQQYEPMAGWIFVFARFHSIIPIFCTETYRSERFAVCDGILPIAGIWWWRQRHSSMWEFCRFERFWRRCLWQLPKLMACHVLGSWLMYALVLRRSLGRMLFIHSINVRSICCEVRILYYKAIHIIIKIEAEMPVFFWVSITTIQLNTDFILVLVSFAEGGQSRSQNDDYRSSTHVPREEDVRMVGLWSKVTSCETCDYTSRSMKRWFRRAGKLQLRPKQIQIQI